MAASTTIGRLCMSMRIKWTKQSLITCLWAGWQAPGPPPPCNEFIASPLGAFIRSGGNKVRLIHDLSFPPGNSVNDFINPDEFRLQYKTIDDAVGICMSFGEEPCYLAKSDLRSAFSSILINPKYWHKLGFEWKGLYYASAVLLFGLRSSPFIFDQFARGLEYMSISMVKGLKLL